MFPLPEPMRVALDAARAAADTSEVPVGAVVMQGDRVVAVAANAPRTLHDPTAHAEILAIRAAAQALGRDRLEDCDLWVTLEPCAMCAAALFYTGVGRIVYGLSNAAILHLRNAQPHTAGLSLSCREVLASAAERVEVVSPCLEPEAAVPHQGYWREGAA